MTAQPIDTATQAPGVPGWDDVRQKPSGAGITIDSPQMPASGVVAVHDTDDEILDGEKAAGGTGAESLIQDQT